VTATATARLGPVDQIPLGEGRAFAYDGEQVAVFRLRSGDLRAVSALCTHSGGPIADGQADDDVVICPLHLHTFDLLSGECRSGQPALRTYRVWVEDGEIVLGGLNAG
jgi:nitrite reductase/ring-hydroxylating ferredoxin subunit